MREESTRRRRRPRSRLLLVVVTLGISLPVVELLVRVLPVDAFSKAAVSLDDRLARYVPHPYLAYAPRPDWERKTSARQVSHNSLGFRGAEFAREKAPGVFRIACLGGSSTYGQGPTRDALTWPALLGEELERRVPGLRVEMINGGVPGYTSYESVANLAFRVLDLQPDLVLVYHGFNDQRFWYRRGLKPDNSHARVVWPTERRSSFDRLLEHSRTFEILRRYLTDYAARRRLAWWTVRDFGDPEARVEPMQPEGPLFFARNLQSIAALARANQARVAFGLQAYYRDDVTVAGEHIGLRISREAVKVVGARREVPVLDLDAVVPQEREFFQDSVHLADAGARLVAETWADFLLAEGLVTP